MKHWLPGLILLLLTCSGSNHLLARDSTSLYNKVFSFPDELFDSINHKPSQFQDKLTWRTQRYLQII